MKLDAQLRWLALQTSHRALEFARRARAGIVERGERLRMEDERARLFVRAWALSQTRTGRMLAAPLRRWRMARWEKAERARRDEEIRSRTVRAWRRHPTPRSSFWDRERGLS